MEPRQFFRLFFHGPDDSRQPIPCTHLQTAIAEAVTKAARDCEAFVGVIINQKNPESPLDANWEVKGVRLDRENREGASEALAKIAARMQREFRIANAV
jgi:hypothetical protein